MLRKSQRRNTLELRIGFHSHPNWSVTEVHKHYGSVGIEWGKYEKRNSIKEFELRNGLSKILVNCCTTVKYGFSVSLMYFINFPDDGFRPKFVFDICGYTVHDKIYSNSVHCLPKK